MNKLIEKEIKELKLANADYERFYEFYFISKNLKDFLENNKGMDKKYLNEITEVINDFFENSLFQYIDEPLSFSKDFPFPMVQIVRIIENENDEKLKTKFFDNIKKSIKNKFEYEFSKKSIDIVSQIEAIKNLLKDDLSDAEIFLTNCCPEE
jgi:hypothetical protein